jgi:uncharacterized membrane protein
LFNLAKKYLNHPKQLVISFLLIFFFHLIFKSLFLDYAGFWYDETFGLWYSQQDWGLIKHTSEWDLNPPLYYYFLWIWRHLFGISEFSIRFSSVLFSSLAAGMIYVFSAKHFSKITGLIALLVFTSSSTILFFAHEARCYSIVLFLTLLSSYLFLGLLKEKKISTAIILGIINFLLIYTHYLAGFILMFQVIIVVIVFKKDFFKSAGIAFLVSFIVGFWRFTAKTIALIFHHEKSFWLKTATWYDLKTTFYDFFNNKSQLLLYVAITLIALGIILYKKRNLVLVRESKIKFLYVLLCGVATILLCFIVGLKTPVFLMRYLLYTSPFLYIAIGFIISTTPQKTKYVLSGFICVLSIYSFENLSFRTPKTMNYRDAILVIKQLESVNTVILAETRDIGPLFAYYYDKDIFSDYAAMFGKMNAKNIYFVSSAADVEALDLKKFDKIILTQSFDNVNPENESLLKFLSSKYKLKCSVKYYNGVNILAYTK